jgi:proline iminopeptidase
LRGIFTLRKSEIDWFYQNGASHVFPDAFARYAAAIPPEERSDFLTAFHKRLTSPDWDTRLKAARAWSRWEGETISIAGPSALPSRFNEDRFVEAFARIENHYFVNNGFFDHDGWLLDQAPRLRHIPCRIAHGRYDMCTPLTTAWELKQRWPEAELEIIHDAGHSSLEPGIVDSLVRATDWMADKAAW